MRRTTHACVAAAAGVALTLGAGCSRRVPSLDRADSLDASARDAAHRAARGDTAGAVRSYRKALASNPDLARAHLDLGILLHDADIDPVGAIYHYREYLRLRPDTEKRAMVQERMRVAGHRFAAGVLRPDAAARRLAELQEENRSLRTKITNLTAEVAAIADTFRGIQRAYDAAVTGMPAQITTRADPAQSGPRTYRVRSGDTLMSIAASVYNDPEQWRRIRQANPEALSGANRLTVGQTLAIP